MAKMEIFIIKANYLEVSRVYIGRRQHLFNKEQAINIKQDDSSS